MVLLSLPNLIPPLVRHSTIHGYQPVWVQSRADGRRAGSGWSGGSAGRPGIPAVIAPDRPHLDGPVPGRRVLGRHLDRLVEIGAVDHVVPGDLLLGLGEGPVAHQQAVVPDLHRGGVADVPEPVTVQQDAPALHLRQPGLDRRSPLRTLPRPPRPLGGLVDAVNQHVLHVAALHGHNACSAPGPSRVTQTTNGAGRYGHGRARARGRGPASSAWWGGGYRWLVRRTGRGDHLSAAPRRCPGRAWARSGAVACPPAGPGPGRSAT